MIKTFTIFIALFAFCSVQTKAQYQNVSNLPSWVGMIDNPKTNYFEALKTFESYWKNKIEPEEEADQNEAEGLDEEKREELKKQLATMSPAERNHYNLIQYHYKRFKKWAFEVRPFVQDDGRILTQQEIADIWNKQQNEIKNQKK